MSRPSASLKEYKALIPYVARFRYQYVFGLICLIVVDAAQIAIPQFIRKAVDLISSGNFQLGQIITLSLYMTGVMAVVAGGRFLWRFFINGSSRRIEAQLRDNLYSHLQKLSWDFYQKNKIGDIMARSITDLHAVRMSIGMGIVALFDFVFMSTAILIIIFVQDARSALVSIIPLPLVSVLILLFGNLVGKKFLAAREAYSRLSDNAQETFAGIRVVKSFVKEWWFIKKFADSNDDYREANMQLVRLFGFFFPFIQFLSGLTVLIMLAIGGMRVINGLMTPGSLVAMFRYLNMLIWPLMGAGFMVNMIQRGAVSLGRINEIFNTPPSIKDADNPSSAPPLSGPSNDIPALELSGLTFSYDETNTVLDGITFKVNRGEWLGIMGRTGSGKTTLIKTFTRMVDPPPGSVRVFGVDVRDWPLEELRKLFAVSPQDSYLFSDSIANNIAYGYGGTDARASAGAGASTEGSRTSGAVEKAIVFASLDNDLALFQQGKDTLVGERGLTLSGGQKQRTAIARAVIMDSEFLILDDSLSAVDNETERKILEALRKERKGRTTIIISHRVSTLKYADKALVLDNGKVIEYGSPEQLAAQEGFYSRMAELQKLEPQTEGQNV